MDNNNENMTSSPGQLLRAQREKLELSMQDIAKRIHLDIKIVEAIESDNHENMPTAIYVRGYLRSYAKVVGANAEEIIRLYDADSPPPPPEILPEVKPPTQASSSDKPVKAFTYLISLGLVLLLLIWYQSNFVVETKSEDQQLTDSSDTNKINGVDTSFEVVVHPDGWQTPASAVTAEDTTDASETSPTEIQDEALQLQTDNGEGALGILPIDDTQIEPSEPLGPDSIILELTRDSWIEIVDANNEKLFHDLGIAGERHSISGTAPFRVLLGFSQGVTVKFNGKVFDQSPYSNNGIARFILPVQ